MKSNEKCYEFKGSRSPIKRFQKIRIEYSQYLLKSRTKSLNYLIYKLKTLTPQFFREYIGSELFVQLGG